MIVNLADACIVIGEIERENASLKERIAELEQENACLKQQLKSYFLTRKEIEK